MKIRSCIGELGFVHQAIHAMRKAFAYVGRPAAVVLLALNLPIVLAVNSISIQ
jgi:hypothetical protein